MIQSFFNFCRESYQELKLASWLSRQDMMRSTVVVIVLTVLLAAYVSLIDRVLLFFASILFRVA